MTEKTAEPQYHVCLDMRDEVGLPSLGLMSGYMWNTNPKRLLFGLARYKFVAHMLKGRGRVAELGCSDGWFSRIVKAEVADLNLFDFDPLFVADANRQAEAAPPRFRSPATRHDILDGPPPHGPYDAIYALDMFEHIQPAREDDYLLHVKQSLAPHGLVILGVPSLECQQYGTPHQLVGHVNVKTGEDLRATMQRHFHTVLMFSMNDEVVHTGFMPMAHYLFAVCAEAK